MTDIAKTLFDGLNTIEDLENLIQSGEAEGLYLECKSPSSPKINQDVKCHIAKAISGFSNTEGGVVIWGVSTTKHSYSGLDIITQVEPIGACSQFKKQIEKTTPLLNVPAITNIQTKVIKTKPKDTKGVVIAYIPKSNHFPVQSLADNLFYFRSGDEFSKAPYELIKRLFSATDTPDIVSILEGEIIKKNVSGLWEIPITIQNNSDAAGRDIKMLLTVENSSSCKTIKTTTIKDLSAANQGRKVYLGTIKDDVLHKGLNQQLGNMLIVLKGQNKKLLITIKIMSDKMRRRTFEYTIMLQGTYAKAKLTKSSGL